MQASSATTTSPNSATATNNPCKPLDTIKGLTRFDKDVEETTSLYFQDIVQRLKGPLLESLRKSKKNFRPFAIRLLVLGIDEGSAKPYMVVFCPTCVSDLVENYFRRASSKRLCQPNKGRPASFDVIVEGQVQATASQHPQSTTISIGRLTSGSPRFRSTHLKVDGVCGTRYATMGGYIVVTEKHGGLSMYGMTAGHTIVQDSLEEEAQSEQASEESIAERNLFPDLVTSASSQVPDSFKDRTMKNTTYNRMENSQEEIEWSDTANVAPASFSTQACDRDWALLEATADQLDGGFQDGQLFERYHLGDARSGTLWIDDGVEMCLQPPFIGKLSRLPSFALLPYGNDFVRVHTITMRNARGIPAGTSGTWVSTETMEPAISTPPQSATTSDINEQPSRITIFGQVVADDSLGDVYMVPMCDILDDIKHVLDARGARLPESNSEVSNILRGIDDTTIDASKALADDEESILLSRNEPEARSSPSNLMSCTRCGSGQHSTELCGVMNPPGGRGDEPDSALVPTVSVSHIPSTYTPSTYSVGKGKHVVWFCSNCGDGPKGIWQNVCSDCSHQRCSACQTEV